MGPDKCNVNFKWIVNLLKANCYNRKLQIKEKKLDSADYKLQCDRIGQHKVLLPINQNYDRIWERN